MENKQTIPSHGWTEKTDMFGDQAWHWRDIIKLYRVYRGKNKKPSEYRMRHPSSFLGVYGLTENLLESQIKAEKIVIEYYCKEFSSIREKLYQLGYATSHLTLQKLEKGE